MCSSRPKVCSTYHTVSSIILRVVSSGAWTRSNLLLLAARQGVGDALASIAERVLGLLQHAGALVRRVVAARAGGVAELLSSRLLVIYGYS